MQTLSKERLEYVQEMLERSTENLTLDDVAFLSNTKTQNGSLIDVNGNVYSLLTYGTHGVLNALLHPEIAKQYNLALPTGDLSLLSKYPYQEFDITMGYKIPNIRISCGLGLTISHGRGVNWPNDVQIEALRQFLVKNKLLNHEVVLTYNVCSARKLLKILKNGELDPDYVFNRDNQT